MLRNIFLMQAVLVGLFGQFALLARAEDRVTPKIFNHLQEIIQPGAEEEKWNQIPWMANLWEARQKAAEEGKPILLWEMDGHPLGCV